MPERDQMTELAVIMENIVKELQVVSKKLDTLQELRVSKLEVDSAVEKEKVGRLQTIVYGCMGAIGLEGLALITGIIIWLIQRQAH
jgi:hypothetical protein